MVSPKSDFGRRFFNGGFMDFWDKDILQKLIVSSETERDSVDFGVIEIDYSNIIIDYNSIEEGLSGYKKDFVSGKNLFLDIAPCMNNYIVALKFEEKEDFDEITPYILSFKIKPVSVDLRLIKNKELKRAFILIKRK